MEYNSFYGGRRGASFVIVKRYETIKAPDPENKGWNRIIREDLGLEKDAAISADQRKQWLMENCMVECFKLGGSYKVVNYDEYVIIDTPNKNDKDNGKIFRRGYNYANDPNELGGAEYIGQIVGPAGMAPQVTMDHYKNVDDICEEDGLVDEEGNEYRKTEGEYAPTADLVPGQYYDEAGTEKFNDKIQWVLCSVRDFYSHETTVHVGFVFPYTVQQYTAKSVSPYYHRTDAEHQDMDNWDETGDTTNFDNDKLIVRTDDLSHPYFQRWHIAVPKGIKGESFNNFRVTTVGECEKEHPGWLQAYAGEEDDRNTIAKIKERKILVFDYYNYDRDKGGDPVSIFLGDYNMIDDFSIDQYGTVTIDYSHDDEEIYKNIFKWIKAIRLNKDTGFFEIEYNYDKTRDGEDKAKENTKYEMYLTWVKDMDISEDGTVSWTYTTPDDDKEYKNFIKWIKEVRLNAETGLFEIDFNYEEKDGEPTHYEQSLQWVKDVQISKDGTVTFTYTNKDDVVYYNIFKLIDHIELNPETGHFTVVYNYENDPESGEPTVYETDLRWVNEVTVDEEGTIKFDYTNGPDTVYEKYLKSIKEVTLDPETGAFDVYYNHDTDAEGNDTHYHADLRWVNHIAIDDEGTITFDYTNGEDDVFEKVFKFIKSVEVDGVTGHVTIDYNYATDKDGNPTRYESDLRYVNDMSIAEDGQVTLHYTHGEDTQVEQKIKWITETTIDPDGTYHVKYNDSTEDSYANIFKYVSKVELTEEGHFTIEFNNGDAAYETDIVWADDLDFLENGTVQLTYNNGKTKDFSQKVKWVNSVNTDLTGKTTVTFNDGTSTLCDGIVKWINKIEYDLLKGVLRFTYNTNETEEFPYKYINEINLSDEGKFEITDSTGAKLLEKTIEYPTKVELVDGHTLKITANTGTVMLNEKLQWVEDIDLVNDKFQLTYNDKTTKDLDLLVNEIDEVTMPTTGEYQYHLLVRYTATEKQGKISYNNKTGWTDLGIIKDYNGILVGMNIDSSSQPELEDPTNALAYLKEQYPNGIEEGYAVGKVVTIGDPDGNKLFYAYDYVNSDWIYLGDISGIANLRTVIAGKADDAAVAAQAANMPTGSLWFVLEED